MQEMQTFQHPTSQTPPPPKRGINWGAAKSIISTLLLLIAAPLIAFFLTAFVFQSFEVDGPSMETTLYDNDRLLVSKLPKTWSRLTNEPYIPARGDIIVFTRSDEGDLDSSERRKLIKRVIALPGERVTVQGGLVTVYSPARPEGFLPDKEMGYGKVIETTAGNVDLTIKPGEVFVLGDNRAHSLDSRSFGTVASNDIIGRLWLRIYPFGNK